MTATYKRYVFRKRGIYYFQRRVPVSLRSKYRGNRVTSSLKTRSKTEALSRAKELAIKLDAYWYELRGQIYEVPLPDRLLTLEGSKVPLPDFEQVKSLYLEKRGNGKSKTFEQTALRAFEYLERVAGKRPIDAYARTDALELRDWLLKRGLAPQSAKRSVSVIRSAVELAINEYGLQLKNVFANIDFGSSTPVHERSPLSANDLKAVQLTCRRMDDPNRWLVALISDTGMRLSEALGLSVSDLKDIDGEIPYVSLTPHPWRSLKTKDSCREIPLVGASLWAAKRIIAEVEGNLAFPAYNDGGTCRSNSASAMLNKWLRSRVAEDGVVVHSFRHSMRDRLRAVLCPSDVIDQIGGWHTEGVGNAYGNGYPLTVLHEWLNRIS